MRKSSLAAPKEAIKWSFSREKFFFLLERGFLRQQRQTANAISVKGRQNNYNNKWSYWSLSLAGSFRLIYAQK